MEKIQTTIPTTYYNEKNIFAEVIWAIKQVLCCHSENSYKGTINLFGVMFPYGKTAANMELRRKKTEIYYKPWTFTLF